MVRLSVQDNDVIEIEPRGGEIMFSIRVKFIDDHPKVPNGAMDLLISPMHMDGGESNTVAVRARG